jgi:DNA-binding MarR family transcriptional regulator
MAEQRGEGGAAFLLAQVGAHAAMRFGKRLADSGLNPPHAGLLRLIASARLSQQELAARLRVAPSKVVDLVDELESRGLVQRSRDSADRRRNVIELTAAGRAALQAIGAAARSHSDDLLKSLTRAERAELTRLLTKIAADQGLESGVHPGYASLR